MLSRFKPSGSVKNDVLQPLVMKIYLGENFLKFRRQVSKMMYRLQGKDLDVDVFVAGDDAHSYVLLQCMQRLLKKYPLRATVRVLPPKMNGYASSFDIKCSWALQDAALLATLYGLKPPRDIISGQSVLEVTSGMCAAAEQLTRTPSGNATVIERTLDAMRLAWDSEGVPAINNAADTGAQYSKRMRENSSLLKSLGFYIPGAVHFQGEFYPPNRLHHLEVRLQEDFHLGLSSAAHKGERELLFNQEVKFEQGVEHRHEVQRNNNHIHLDDTPQQDIPVELFYSFRSPYSQLILRRIRRICSYYRKRLVLRPVLPMVTRGLKVPLEKQLYIIKDAAREARIWGIPFGELIDPLHPDKMPFLRAFDAYGVAQSIGKELDFVESFATCQWGKGISAGTDDGLKIMISMAGMADMWDEVKRVIYSENSEQKFSKWQKITSSNQECIINNGLWGVPCFRYGDIMYFGQDKLWTLQSILEAELLKKDGCLNFMQTSCTEQRDMLIKSIYKYGTRNEMQ